MLAGEFVSLIPLANSKERLLTSVLIRCGSPGTGP